MMTKRSHKIPRWDSLGVDGSVAHFAESGLERKVDWRRLGDGLPPGDRRETFPGFRVVSPHFRLLSRGCSVHWLCRSTTHKLPIWVGRGGPLTLGDDLQHPTVWGSSIAYIYGAAGSEVGCCCGMSVLINGSTYYSIPTFPLTNPFAFTLLKRLVLF